MAVDKVQELQEQRNGLAAEIKELGNTQESWTDEQRARWEDVNAEYDSVLERQQAEKEKLDVSARLDTISEERERSEWQAKRNNEPTPINDDTRSKALLAWCQHQSGMEVGNELNEAATRCGVDPRRSFFEINLRAAETFNNRGFGSEYRAQSTSSTEGGYTIPEGFSNELERALLAFGGPRRVSRILRTASGNTIPFPTVNDSGNKGAILAENTQVSEQDVVYASINLSAYKYSSRLLRVSAELMQDSAFNLGAELGSMIGERLGRITAEHFTTGTGSSQPEGIVTGSTLGVTAASATAITMDELIDLLASIDPAYQDSPSCGFMMHNSVKSAVRKLKDSNNQYLWQPGLTSDAPDVLLGKPVVVNQEMASSIAASAKTVLCGDFSKFLIRDCGSIRLARMDERYRDYDQTGFVAFSRHDSVLLDAGTNPVKHLVQAAS
jgi:HK97 family phage major capsid protein